jgi:hypothetical protein
MLAEVSAMNSLETDVSMMSIEMVGEKINLISKV